MVTAKRGTSHVARARLNVRERDERNLECRKCGLKKQDNRRTVALGHMTLEKLVFNLLESPFLSTRKIILYGNNMVTKGCVMR